MSESTGIIFNNQMNDFSIPAAASDGLLPAPANFVVPGKSPMSSMSPIIVLNKDKEVQVVVGGAGGILIMTSVIQFILYFLFLNKSVEESLAMQRLHHQLQPMRILHENQVDTGILEFLRAKGHATVPRNPGVSGFASVIAIGRNNGTIEAGFDPRRGGNFIIF